MLWQDRTKQADFFFRIRSYECIGLRKEESLFVLPSTLQCPIFKRSGYPLSPPSKQLARPSTHQGACPPERVGQTPLFPALRPFLS